MSTLFPLLTALYLFLSLGRRTRDIAHYPLPEKNFLTEPYECVDMSGNLAICNKGQCNGAWKPPRTHHCSTCGVCRLDFDHHCPWVCMIYSERHFLDLKADICVGGQLRVTVADERVSGSSLRSSHYLLHGSLTDPEANDKAHNPRPHCLAS